MKRIIFNTILCSLLLAFSACEQKNVPDNSNTGPKPKTYANHRDSIVEQSFPMKHIIEEFTGMSCVYCPNAMDCVHSFVENDTNWIVVMHYNYNHVSTLKDTTLFNEFNVKYIPRATMDRAGRELFDPRQMTYWHREDYEGEETYVSLNINNTYDSISRKLNVAISGLVGKSDFPDLKLTVLLKESGIIEMQADASLPSPCYWEEYCHTDIPRVYMTDVLGDATDVDNYGKFANEFELDMDSTWEANNCMVVAFVSEEIKPIIQVEQRPVVAGTMGGADIHPGGITPAK